MCDLCSFGARRDGDRPQLYPATCASCGKACELPFRPSGDRPVYCRDCFAKNGGGEKRSFGRDDRGSRDNNRPSVSATPSTAQLDAIDSKLNQILKLLTPVTPVAAQKAEKKAADVVEAPVEKTEVVVKTKKVAKKAPKTPKE